MSGRDEYVRAAFGPREPVLDDILRSSLLGSRMPTIQVDDNTGRTLQMLTTMKAPKRVIELGTLFGYSAIYIARGLPEGGKLTTIERQPQFAELARRNVEKAGLDDRVEVITTGAAEYLAGVPSASVGMIFIDADKASYAEYLKLCVPLLEPKGLLVADDAYGIGDFSGEGSHDDAVAGVRAYVRAACGSKHLLSCFAGVNSGLLVTMKV